MERERVPMLTTVDAIDLHRCCDDKIAGVLASTADVPPTYLLTYLLTSYLRRLAATCLLSM